MPPNPVLKRLGYSDTDRLVIIHTDDIGMCQATLTAFDDLWQNGLISSGAIMMPCPWARAAAEYCRTHPGVDMGVHATLNAEWELYRWGPLTRPGTESGLVDADGFLWRSTQEAQKHGDPDAVQAELQLQVQRALDWGVDVTHIDTHMGTVAHPRFFPAFLQTAFQFRIPTMLPRPDAVGLDRMGVTPETTSGLAPFLQMVEGQGMPLLDGLMGMPLDRPEGQVEIAKALLTKLPAGVTHFLIHPSTDTPELRAIAPDWPSRVANYRTFLSKEIKDFVKNAGIQVIGYRHLRDVLRNEP